MYDSPKMKVATHKDNGSILLCFDVFGKIETPETNQHTEFYKMGTAVIRENGDVGLFEDDVWDFLEVIGEF